MKKYHKFLVLAVLLLTATNLWAQPPDLPEGACVTPEVSECQQNPEATLFKWSEGTDAWPDSACNPERSFGDCDTNSCDHANAWALNVCEAIGFEVGIWTSRKQAGCGPGGPGGPVTDGTGDISMFCRGTIPCIPFVETECFPPDQTQVEVFCCNKQEPPPPLAQVPTLSEWGLIAMAGILGTVGFMVIRRRKVTA
jgi:hypothetical protein